MAANITRAVPENFARGWSAEDVALLLKLDDAKVAVPVIAATLGRTISSIMNKLREEKHTAARGPATNYAPSYELISTVENDDDSHIARIASANDGYGFPIVTEPLLSRLYALEIAPARKRLFHEAA